MQLILSFPLIPNRRFPFQFISDFIPIADPMMTGVVSACATK